MLCFVLGKALYSHNTSLSPTGESVGSGRLLGKIYVGGRGGVGASYKQWIGILFVKY